MVKNCYLFVGFIEPFFPYVFVWNLNSSLSYLLSNDTSNHQNSSSWWPKYLLKSWNPFGTWKIEAPGSSMPRWRAKPRGFFRRLAMKRNHDESATEFPYVSWLRSDITVTERNLKKCVCFFFGWRVSFHEKCDWTKWWKKTLSLPFSKQNVFDCDWENMLSCLKMHWHLSGW